MPATAGFGVIGGSGFYNLDALEDAQRIDVTTPFGAPSSPLVLGTLEGKRVAFIARHGEGHRLLPSEVPSRANIWALKSLGVRRVLAVSAVGSLRPQFEPLHALVPDQLIDRTRGRPSSFFGDGIVAHIGFADPFCPEARDALFTASDAQGVRTHPRGSLVVIDGPAFSTRAESQLYRAWDADIIGMTALPEAKLAREAELCYASICYITDYDVWHEHEADVSVELIVERLQQNIAHARATVAAAVAALPAEAACACGDALASAVLTAPEAAPPNTRERLALLLDRYWGPAS
jgi:5'-methylthioadenosine phosphorylase